VSTAALFKPFADVHVHIGQYEDAYYEAEEVFDAVFSRPEVVSILYSSTTSCKEGVSYSEIEEEMDYAALCCPKNKFCSPLLWYKPEYIAQGVNPIQELENARGRYGGIKLHPFADNWDFEHNHHHRDVLHSIFGSAGYTFDNILIHTGESGRDRPTRFLPFFDEYPRAPVILAHGRPVNSTIKLLHRFKGFFCDTAFIGEESVRAICAAGLCGSIFTGSDFPITHYFSTHGNSCESRLSLAEQYARDVAQMKKYQSIIMEAKNVLPAKV
jgi:predicted TIM-barrel fold metal-dependent hydrolase